MRPSLTLSVLLSGATIMLFVMAYYVIMPTDAQPDEHGSYLNLKSQVYPAGTQIAYIPSHGARVMYIHRNYMVMSGEEPDAPGSVWDISDLRNPELIREFPGANGHMWWQYATDDGMILHRSYNMSELTGNGIGTYNWIDLSALPNLQPYTGTTNIHTGTNVRYRVTTGGFPYSYASWSNGGELFDIRSGASVGRYNFNATTPGGVGGGNIFILGNLMFMTPHENHNALTVWDISNPAQPRLLDSMDGLFQYTNSIHVWRHYIICLAGGDINPDAAGNPNSANMMVVDFSDPTNLRLAWTEPFSVVRGRYMTFQDQYAFSGQANDFRQYDMERREVVQVFRPTPNQRGDFMLPPIGSNIIISGCQVDGGNTHIFSTSSEADNRPPSVGYHLPRPDATNQSLTTAIGFVINETLIGETVIPQNIRVRPVGGDPIQGDVMHTQFQTVQWAPRQPLQANTTYEVTLLGDGIKDVSGNGIEEYTFYFSTGPTIENGRNEAPIISSIIANPVSPVGLGTAVTFSGVVSDPNDDALEYQWDFGDGTTTNWSVTLEAIHTYSNAGKYPVRLRARDSENAPVLFSSSIVVTQPMGNPPIKSSEMAINSLSNELWTVNPDNNSVTIVNLDNFQRIAEVPVGRNPTSIAFDGDHNAWVTCQKSNSIVIISPDRSVIQTITLPYGAAPVNIVFDHGKNFAYVAEYGAGNVRKINVAARGTETLQHVGPTPKAMAINSTGEHLAVTRFVSPDAGGQIWQLATEDLFLQRTLTISPDNAAEDTPTQSRGIANYLGGVSFSPSTEALWYASKKDNIFRGQSLDGQALTFESTLRNQSGSFNIATGVEDLNSRLSIDNHAQMADITFGPYGNEMFVAMQSNNVVIAVDPVTRMIKDTINVGLTPQSLLVDTERNLLYVKNFMSRSINVIDVSGMILQGSGDMTLLHTIQLVSNEMLPPQVLLGKQIFYNAADPRMSLDGYISCASCHLNGADDGRTWDFTDRGEGIRNTTTLHGRAGMGQGRVHWSANFDEIQDFENDIRGAFGGGGFMSSGEFSSGTTSDPLGDAKAGRSAELDALAAYVTSLDEVPQSPYRNEDGTMTVAALEGQVIFNNLGCGNCHNGPDLTDSPLGLRHDVGTIKAGSGQRRARSLLGIDAPTLVGIWATAPYLHDGSAATLHDVLTTANPDDSHGAVSSLSSDDVDNLVAYLLQLDGSDNNVTVAQAVALTINVPEEGIAGESLPLSITTNIDPIDNVIYYADGQEIAASSTLPFDASWQVPADRDGEVEIVAKAFYNNGLTATVSPEAHVSFGVPVTSVSITPASATLEVGQTLQLTGSVLPANASDPSITWSASNNGVLVTQAGRITASRPGTTTVRATASNGVVGTAVITVTVPVNNITITPSSPLQLEIGDVQQLTAAVFPANAESPTYTWVSTNTNIVTVNASGVVTAVGEGSAQIRAVHSPTVFSALQVVVVSPPVPVEEITIHPAMVELAIGDQQQLTAVVSPSDATEPTYSWTSDDESIVTVDANGLLTATGVGETTVRAVHNGNVFATLAVIVTESTVRVEGIQLADEELSLVMGERYEMTYSVIPENATNQHVTWSSDNESVVTVTADGVITAISPGSAYVTVISEDGMHAARVHITVGLPDEKNLLDIPKFFSPNNDEHGQYWVWQNLERYAGCHVSVFARNGREVFRAKPYDNEWSGTSKNGVLPAGDYYYVINCDDGKVLKGAVRIIK